MLGLPAVTVIVYVSFAVSVQPLVGVPDIQPCEVENNNPQGRAALLIFPELSFN